MEGAGYPTLAASIEAFGTGPTLRATLVVPVASTFSGRTGRFKLPHAECSRIVSECI